MDGPHVSTSSADQVQQGSANPTESLYPSVPDTPTPDSGVAENDRALEGGVRTRLVVKRQSDQGPLL